MDEEKSPKTPEKVKIIPKHTSVSPCRVHLVRLDSLKVQSSIHKASDKESSRVQQTVRQQEEHVLLPPNITEPIVTKTTQSKKDNQTSENNEPTVSKTTKSIKDDQTDKKSPTIQIRTIADLCKLRKRGKTSEKEESQVQKKAIELPPKDHKKGVKIPLREKEPLVEESDGKVQEKDLELSSGNLNVDKDGKTQKEASESSSNDHEIQSSGVIFVTLKHTKLTVLTAFFYFPSGIRTSFRTHTCTDKQMYGWVDRLLS